MLRSSNFRFDHLVAIERSGRAEDGNYYNMRGINIKHLVDPIDDLFIAAKTISGVSTTGEELKPHSRTLLTLNKCQTLSKWKVCLGVPAGVGDGGNELGMGKVKQKVKSLMPMGDLVACDVPADFAITAGQNAAFQSGRR